ncbi:MAG TPA: hypothetical protein VJ600_09560 [Holophagaceae bacterium]|nr:hypothetical protein [Holophagaceae bacterium]
MIPFPTSLQPAPGAADTFTLAVEPEHPAFLGHFPGQPILPGVVQIDWALRLGMARFGPLGTFRALEHLKFQDIIRPAEPLTLILGWNEDRRELAFEYRGASGAKSKGFAVFA